MTFNITKKLIVKKIYWLGLLGIASIQALSVNPCLAQSSNIITDDSLGNETSQVEKNSQLQGLPVEIIRGGAQRGINLFHSFREFNVSEGRGAYFFSPNAQIQNILTRVTGSNRSEILGTLGTFGNSQPNLFLINPNGILFGENASLDVKGSFVGTTANGIQFGERGVFSATNPEAPALLTVNPSALFFNQVNAQASIQNSSIAPAQTDPAGFGAFGLRVPDGKSLLLLGGNVTMDGGGLNAYGGRVELGGLTEPGTIALDINGDNFSLGFPENVKRGDVSLTNLAGIYVESDGGGDIVVNAQNLEITTLSSLNAGIGPGLGSDNSKAGNIDINATQIVKLNNSEIRNDVEAEARGHGGDVNISTNTLLLQDGALVSTSTGGKGKGGDLTVNAQDVQLIGETEDGFPGGLFASAQPDSTGDAGNLTLSTHKLLVQDGALVVTGTGGKGNGGKLTVNAQDVQLIGTGQDGFGSGLSSAALPNSTGNAGNLTLSTNKLLVQDGAVVVTGTAGKGKGGKLTVNAQDVQVIGTSEDGLPSSLFAAARRNSTGNGSNLTLSTNKLLVQDGAQIGSGTFGEGNGGDLIVNAQDVQVIGTSEVGRASGLFASAGSSSTGNGGKLTVSTHKLLVQDGAQISSATFGEGNGGDLTVNAQDVQLIGTTEVGRSPSGLFASAEPNSTGDGSNLTVSTNKLLVQDGAQVSSSTLGEGKGGDLIVNAQDVQLIGTSEDPRFPSGLFASARPNSTGNAGKLTLSTHKLLVQDGARVSTSTDGNGNGAKLTVNAQSLQLKNEATITAQSTDSGTAGNIEINIKDNFNADNGQVITQSEQTTGGNIDITGKNIILRNDSNIRTTLSTTSDSGGNITLTANTIVALEDSDILAFAPEGSGGDITFNTRAFLSNPLYRPTPQTADKEILDALDGNNRVDVNASGSISTGNIIGIPDISFLQDNLRDLPSNQIDTNALIASSCISRSNKRQENSFIITGSGGLRNSPVDGFVSKFSTGDVRNIQQISRPWKKGDPIVEPTGVYRLADGRLILGRVCE